MMKRLVAASVLVFGLVAPALAATRTVMLHVDNMYCEMCPLTVKKGLTKVDGVSAAQVSFEKKTATVTYDDAKTNVAALIAATTNAGYPSRVAQ